MMLYISRSVPQPFEDGRHVHLVGLVVEARRVHEDVGGEAKAHLALLDEALKTLDKLDTATNGTS